MDGPAVRPFSRQSRRDRQSRPTGKCPLAKFNLWCWFLTPQRVFEVAPLVPGSPSLDGKPHSPGGTRRRGIQWFRDWM